MRYGDLRARGTVTERWNYQPAEGGEHDVSETLDSGFKEKKIMVGKRLEKGSKRFIFWLMINLYARLHMCSFAYPPAGCSLILEAISLTDTLFKCLCPLCPRSLLDGREVHDFDGVVVGFP